MPRTILSISVIIFLSLFFSCSKAKINRNDLKGNFKFSHTLEQDHEVSFPLDAETPQSLKSIQVYENDSIRLFTFLNDYNNAVYFYDYDKRKPIKKILFEREGPNGTSSSVLGHYIKSMDSIFLFSYKTKFLFLFNSKADLINKFHTKPIRKKYLPSAYPNNGTSMTYFDDHMYLIGYTGGEFMNEDSLNRPIVTIQNLKDKSVKYAMGYPSSYRKGNWGGAQFRLCKWDYNPKTQKFIFSFPNEHYLYTSDFSDKTEKFYAGSIYSGNIKSLDVPKMRGKNKPRRRRLYATNPSYLSIVYDRYRDVYYRFAQQPVKEYDDEKDNCYHKPFSIIILDNSFNIIGEKKMEMEEYINSPYIYFVTKEGLHLCHESDNEDEIKFTVYKLKST